MPPTRTPLMKTPTGSSGPAPSSRTLIHVHQAASLPVEQLEEPTLRDGPVVTPRPPTRSAGRYSRRSTEKLPLSSSRRSIEPLPLRAQLTQLLAVFCQIATGTRRETPWVRTRIVIRRPGVAGRGHYRPELPRRGVPGKGHYKPEQPMPGVPGRGHYRLRFPARLSADWHRRLLILLPNTPQIMWCCSGSPRSIFRSGRLRRLSSTACQILARSSL